MGDGGSNAETWRAASEAIDVLMIGPVPPPFGGVAAHVARLRERLDSRGVSVGILSHYRRPHETEGIVAVLNRNPLRYWTLTRRHRSRIVHYHHSHWVLLAAVALVARGDDRQFVITLHGQNVLNDLRSHVPLVAAVNRWALRQFDHVIAVSREVAAGVSDCVDPSRVHVIPAFLEPPAADPRALDREAERFLSDGCPTLVISCSQIASIGGPTDPYGLDVAIRAFCAIGHDNPLLRMALFAGRRARTQGEEAYLRSLKERIVAAGLSDRFLMRTEMPLLPAFRHDVIYVRATRTEGDAVSVREALWMGVPVVASDVVRRPEGAVLVSEGEDLADVLAKLLAERATTAVGTAAARTAAEPQADRLLEELISIYQTGLSGDLADDNAESPGGTAVRRCGPTRPM
jgi:glycosyltransferase involved in cell wall biosynthesis